MFKVLLSLLLLTSALAQSYNISGSCVPFGTRLSYGPYYSQQGNNPTQIYVTFNTLGNCTGIAYWGNLNNYSSYNCTSSYIPYNWVTPPYFETTVYTCPISSIDYTQSILYTVAGVDGNNNQFLYLNKNISITLSDWNGDDQVTFLTFGDWNYQPVNTSLGYAPISNCLNVLASLDKTKVNGILFLGDMAYNLSSNNGTNYVQFLTMLQPFSSIWPFMATLGNHQQLSMNDLTVFNLSFNYPYAEPNNSYYNFSVGQVTVVSFNPDAVVYFDSNATQVLNTLTAEFNYSLTNAATKYVIPMSHFPFFCSMVSNVSQCSSNNQSLFPLQQLFVNSKKVPIYLSAHIHTYQRSYPVNLLGQVTSDNLYQYDYPQPPIYVIEGAAGNNQYIVTNNNPYPLLYYTATQVSGSGFGILTVTQNGDITYNHVLGSNCAVADNFIINAQQAGSNSGTGFPVWLIVLLSILGLLVVLGIAWFCFSNKKDSVKQFINTDLQASYKSMELKNGM